MYCKNCGKLLSDDDKYCSGCGFRNEDKPINCSTCGAIVKDSDSICSNCGILLKSNNSYDGSKINSNSGYNQSYNNVGEYKNEQPQKSKVVAGILGILVGGLGIHRFYLGYVGIGILQIILTIITFGAAGMWGFIEGILILCGSGITTDSNGRPLSDR